MSVYVSKKCREPGCPGSSADGTYYLCDTCGTKWWLPHEGPQTRFVSSQVHEILYGGAAGGGKSAALCMIPLRWIAFPHFNAIIFRRETNQLAELIKHCEEWFPHVDPGARSKQEGKGVLWVFSSGARLRLQHLKDPADAKNYNGWEFQFIGFDELTHFTWFQYKELKGRIRSPYRDVPRYMRCTSNPGGEGHEWVLERWGAWLNPKFETECGEGSFLVDKVKVHTAYGLKKRDGRPYLDPCEVGWILKPDGVDRELFVPAGTHGALSRTFIPALLSDNPALMQGDPNYSRVLADNDAVRREQLEKGNWLATPGAGKFFKRAWFPTYETLPQGSGIQTVRYWDRACTEPTADNAPDPDYTVGLKMTRIGDNYYIEHVKRFRESPGTTEAEIKATCAIDGPKVNECLEQDPGSAGKFEVYHYMRALSGSRVLPIRPSGDKITRAGPASTQAQVGAIYVPKHAPWLDDFFREIEAFPTKGVHDDQVDALSGAYYVLHRLGGPHKASVQTNADSGSAAEGAATHAWSEAAFG